MKYRIFLVDDHPVMREGYRSLLEREPDMDCCGEAGSGFEALDRIPEADPDLVLVDLLMPELSGLELLKQLSSLYPELPTLVVSAHDEALYAERALRAGAQGYLMKREVSKVVIEAIRTVLSGRRFLSEGVRDLFAQRYLGTDAEPGSPLEQLTDRELEVFEHLGRGLTTREIAESMNISPKTVETYRSNIKQKLALDNISELIQRAVIWVDSETG